MIKTALDKGVVVCSCGSASFVGVDINYGKAFQYKMKKNWDLTLEFEGDYYSKPARIFCAGCGDEVSVSLAVKITGGD